MEREDIHKSHVGHADFLAKHVAKLPKPPAPKGDEDKPSGDKSSATGPELAPAPRSVPASHAPEHEEHV